MKISKNQSISCQKLLKYNILLTKALLVAKKDMKYW